MDDIEAYKIAIDLMMKEIHQLKEYADRYEREPKLWPEHRGKHERYIALVAAIALLEAKTHQMRFNI